MRVLHVPPVESTFQESLAINVVFTDFEATRAALRRAWDLAGGLGAETRIVVPYPLPLNEPQVAIEFTRRKLRAIANELGVSPRLDVFLCRDRVELLARILKPRTARTLRQKGFDVLLAQTGK